MKPQNQVTVHSSETDLVFRMNRSVAERHDTLTILEPPPTCCNGEPSDCCPEPSDDTLTILDDLDPEDAPSQSAEPADPIAAPVADDN